MKTAVEYLHSEYKRILGSVLVTPQQIIEISDALENAKEIEKGHLQTHKYSEFDLISAFEYGWNQRHFDKTDEDELQQIQKRFIQSINETKQQEQ
jgi:hypothetical protein